MIILYGCENPIFNGVAIKGVFVAKCCNKKLISLTRANK
jgi:hypothetical protein